MQQVLQAVIKELLLEDGVDDMVALFYIQLFIHLHVIHDELLTLTLSE